MKNKKIVIAAASLALIAAASIGPASAYFTASQSAYGTRDVYLGDGKLDPKETVDEKTGTIKTVNITNTSNFDVWVRVKVFSPVDIEPTLGDNWEKADAKGFYQYKTVLEAGDTTKDIVFKVKLPEVDAENITDDTQTQFNVIIVEEATRATYGDDGTPNAPDWELKADATRVETKVTPQPVNQQPTPEGGQR